MLIFRKFWKLLSRRQHLYTFSVLFLTFLGAIFEAIGVGLIVPLVAIVADPNFAIPDNLSFLNAAIKNLDQTKALIFILLSFMGFYFIKTAYLIFLAAIQTLYYNDIQEKITIRLFSSYIRRPYSFHLQNNSGTLISNTITETMQFSVGFTASALLVINDVLVAILILSVLFLHEPTGALASIVLFVLASILLFRFSKSRSLRYGQTRQEKERKRVQSAQEGFNGIKDIKLYGRETLFEDNYHEMTRISLEAGRKQTILQNVPRNFLEFVAVVVFCCLVLYLNNEGDGSNIMETLGLFAAAAFKLLPTFARLNQSCQSILYTMPVVTHIHDELILASKEIEKKEFPCISESQTEVKFENTLVVSHLGLKYVGNSEPVLFDINFHVNAGDMIGFIGPSGAGKSSLIDCLLGLIEPTEGRVNIDGTLLSSSNRREWQSQVGYVSQQIFLIDGTIRENIAFGLRESDINDDQIRMAVRSAQLEEFVRSLADGVDTFVGENGVRLSGGQRQRIGIARALYSTPRILVLDEATSALDIETEREVMRSVEELKGNITIIIIAHRYATVENCNRIYKLDEGRIVGYSSNVQDLIGTGL